MYRRLAYPKLLRGLPHSGAAFNDKIGNVDCPFLNIILHGIPPDTCFYKICGGRRGYAGHGGKNPERMVPPRSSLSVGSGQFYCVRSDRLAGNVLPAHRPLIFFRSTSYISSRFRTGMDRLDTPFCFREPFSRKLPEA